MIYRNIDKKVLNKILDKVNEMNLPILIEEGCLIDNYLIRNINNRNQVMTLANGKAYKYIMIVEIYVNEWTSRWDIITTNNFHRVKKYFNEEKAWKFINE